MVTWSAFSYPTASKQLSPRLACRLAAESCARRRPPEKVEKFAPEGRLADLADPPSRPTGAVR
jgi:hypothetical protein